MTYLVLKKMLKMLGQFATKELTRAGRERALKVILEDWLETNKITMDRHLIENLVHHLIKSFKDPRTLRLFIKRTKKGKRAKKRKNKKA